MPNLLDMIGCDCTRRAFLGKAAAGIGTMALASLLNPGDAQAAAATASLASRGMINPLHFPPKAKRVIWLYMAGGPSHLETFDYKPQAGRSCTASRCPSRSPRASRSPSFRAPSSTASRRSSRFKRFGKSGQEICELFPHIGSVADEICIVRSMKTEAINHDPAHTFMNTGTTISGRPAMGSWVLLRPGQREPTTCPASSC